MNNKLNNIEFATDLARESGLIGDSGVCIQTELDLDSTENEEVRYMFKVKIDIREVIREFKLTGNEVVKLNKWYLDSKNKDTCAMFMGLQQDFELVKHSSITGIRVETDWEFNALLR